MPANDQIRIAIVEDNATARGNLRSHLLSLGNLEISSFSSGNELKSALRKQYFEVVLIDYHLGQHRTGVEWLHILRQGHFIKPSTGVIFVTADRQPQTIGQIVDVHPDVLVLKPYTIATLHRNIQHYLQFRHFVWPVLRALDDKDLQAAQTQLNKLASDVPARLRADYSKLRARVLLQKGNVRAALDIYNAVLQKSDRVLWAQWGKIKCQYLAGDWDDCRGVLDLMSGTSINRDKAFEWLACLSFEQEAYEQAEFYLDHINVSDLSIPATRLKSIAYQKQNRVVEGVELLEKKRAYNRSTKERFDEFTFELAEFYLSIAEQSPMLQRRESLSQARKLIGIASRSQTDQQQMQKQDYLMAHTAALEGDIEKAKNIIAQDHMQVYLRTAPATLIVAAKVHQAAGNTDTARSLMELAEDQLIQSDTISQQQADQSVLLSAEKNAEWVKEKAEALNHEGTQAFTTNAYPSAVDYFYKAYQLDPETASFSINLLHSMLQASKATFRKLTLYVLIEHIKTCELSESSRTRFAQVLRDIQQHPKLGPALKKQRVDHNHRPTGDDTPSDAPNASTN